MLIHSFPMKSRKAWIVTCLIILTHMPALIMKSLIQTAGHNMAAIAVVFLRTSNIDFYQTGWKIE